MYSYKFRIFGSAGDIKEKAKNIAESIKKLSSTKKNIDAHFKSLKTQKKDQTKFKKQNIYFLTIFIAKRHLLLCMEA